MFVVDDSATRSLTLQPNLIPLRAATQAALAGPLSALYTLVRLSFFACFLQRSVVEKKIRTCLGAADTTSQGSVKVEESALTSRELFEYIATSQNLNVNFVRVPLHVQVRQFSQACFFVFTSLW